MVTDLVVRHVKPIRLSFKHRQMKQSKIETAMKYSKRSWKEKLWVQTSIASDVSQCFGKCLVKCSSTTASRGENNRRAFSIATAREGNTVTFLSHQNYSVSIHLSSDWKNNIYPIKHITKMKRGIWAYYMLKFFPQAKYASSDLCVHCMNE